VRALAERLAAAFGYRLLPLAKLREPFRQLAAALARQQIDAVIDVGANEGQYAGALRAAGWRGPLLSIEPIPAVQARLAARAAADPCWQVLPPLAAGAADGTIVLEVAAESDMSSTLPQGPLLARLSPSSAVIERLSVTQRRLDGLDELARPGWRRLFVKIDVQGAEPAVLDGCAGLWPRIAGLQLELALVPLYVGERDWRSVLDGLTARGFAPYLFIPGYFEPKLARQVQVDVVLFRDEPVAAAGAG
jgi:FkbM family methyltransferase